MMATNDNYFDIETSDTQNEPDSDSGTKPKVFKDGQYTDPLFKKLSRINGEVNKLSKSELQGKLKELGLDPRGLKEVLRKRLKNYHRKKNMKKAKININGKTAYDYLAVIDFEATCDENNPSYRHEIIEFPIVLIDVDKMEIVDKFHEYVKPLVNPKLTPFCTKLTGITQDQVDGANIFPDVLSNVNTWLQDHHLGSQKSFAVLTDGPWDMFRFMYYQCKESKIEMPIWSKRWVNIRKAYCNFYQCGRGGIEIMLKNLGMTFEGSPHSGIDDSVNIARIAIKMLNDGCALTMNEKLVVKTNAHDSSTSVRYEPYKDTGLSPEQEEEEKRRKKEKRKERLEMEQKMSNLSVNDVEWTEDDDLDDLLNYYKLQKS